MRKLLWIYLLCLLFSCEKFQGGVYYFPEADIYLKWVVPDSGWKNTLFFSKDTNFGDDYIIFDTFYYAWGTSAVFYIDYYPTDTTLYIVDILEASIDTICSRHFIIRHSKLMGVKHGFFEDSHQSDSFPLKNTPPFSMRLSGPEINAFKKDTFIGNLKPIE